MGVLFDTSVLIGLERASSRLDKFILGREGEPFGISAITVSGLLHGVHPRTPRNGESSGGLLLRKSSRCLPFFPSI